MVLVMVERRLGRPCWWVLGVLGQIGWAGGSWEVLKDHKGDLASTIVEQCVVLMMLSGGSWEVLRGLGEFFGGFWEVLRGLYIKQ